MERDKVVTTVLEAVLKKGQEEISSLIGQPVEYTDSKMLESVRETLFEGLQDQQVLATLQVEGDQTGSAWVMVDFRDALTLGGTLIMLPENELQERIDKGAFGEDEADAFGEIVNILTGVMSGLFDELFPDNLRFVKTGLELINPLQVVTKADYPISEGALKIVSGTGTLQEKPLYGPLQIIVPAVLLGLEGNVTTTEPAEDPTDEPAAEPAEESTAPAGEPASSDAGANDDSTAVAEASSDAAASADAPADTPSEQTDDNPEPVSASDAKNPDSSVSKQKLEKILAVVHSKMRDEVGGFLGHTFSLKNEEFCQISREDTFSGLNGTHVLARMSVEGDRDGQGYLMVDLNAAIRLGGTLIMLPESELEDRLESGDYGAEDSDAFGEIVNIIAGIYTAVFNDLYPGHLRFIKTDQDTVDPLVIEAKGEYPVNEESFFVARGEAFLGDKSLGIVSVFIPIDVLGLDQSVSEEQPAAVGNTEADAVSSDGESGSSAADADPEVVASGSVDGQPVQGTGTTDAEPLVFVYGDSEEQVDSFIKAIEGINLTPRFKHVQDGSSDDLHAQSARGVFLVMADVGEQGIAAAIKIHAAVQDRMPLIAAGPNWTRSMVLRAIKYGIHDILVTPASEAQIQEKVRSHLNA